MEGLYFLVTNQPDQYFKKILKGLGTENYFWKISEDEVYKKNEEQSNCYSDLVFEKNVYTNKEFFNILEKNIYAIFCNIQLYSNIEDIEDINTPEDFIKSKCELILILTDDHFFEVYYKNPFYKELIIKNLNEMGVEDIKKINVFKRKTMLARGD